MQSTYTRTLFHPDLTKAKVEVWLTEKPKYEQQFEAGIRVEYRGVTSWTIVEGGEEAEEIEKDTDGSCIDENHEYLILTFEDGSTATFRNSHAVMFIL